MPISDRILAGATQGAGISAAGLLSYWGINGARAAYQQGIKATLGFLLSSPAQLHPQQQFALIIGTASVLAAGAVVGGVVGGAYGVGEEIYNNYVAPRLNR